MRRRTNRAARGAAAGVLITALGLFSAACGSPTATPPPLPKPTSATSVTSTTATTTTRAVAPETTTTTAIATTSTSVTEPAEMLLLAYGDSFAAKSGWPTQYARLAEQELGVTVKVAGTTCTLGCDSVLGVIQRDREQEQIGRADIIVIQPKPGRAFSAAFNSFLSGSCGGADGQQCIRDAKTDFETYVDELLDAVIMAADPQAVVRAIPAGTWALDFFYPDLRSSDPESFEVMITAMTDFVHRIAESAAARCVLVSDVSAILTGADYRTPINPAHTTDGAHPSTEGARLIAEDLNSLGYEPTPARC